MRVVSRSGSAVELAASEKGAAPAASASTEGRWAAAEEKFSIALLRQLASSDATGAQNVAVSPSSVGTALSMLELGAAGPTEEQIARLLGLPDESAAAQAAAWQASSTDESASASRDGIDLQSANSIWTQINLPMDPEFMSALARYFAAGVWQADFAGNPGAATHAINNWVSSHTDGKISQLFAPGQLNTLTRVVLANAEYFDAPWLAPFDPSLTMKGPFTTSTGGAEPASFMTSEQPMTVPVSIAGGLQTAQLAYKGGRFAALIMMPTAGTVADLVDRLSAASLDRIVAGLQTKAVRLSLPRFQLQTGSDLSPALQAMGMRDAFGGAADLSPMSPGAGQVQSVEQKVYLKVTEQGTEAAAATGVGVGATAAEVSPLAITFDHPFLFLVRDTVTGSIQFAAEVQNPAG
jgi:serpin B